MANGGGDDIWLGPPFLASRLLPLLQCALRVAACLCHGDATISTLNACLGQPFIATRRNETEAPAHARTHTTHVDRPMEADRSSNIPTPMHGCDACVHVFLHVGAQGFICMRYCATSGIYTYNCAHVHVHTSVYEYMHLCTPLNKCINRSSTL